MEIIPAIDLRNGKCVRLYQGNYDIETVFSEDPVDVALKWQSLGAKRLHIIDLDGAATGDIGNMQVIRDLATAMLIPTQMGGGIRSMETIGTIFKAGIDRIILGTAAVEDSKLVKEACRRFGDSIVVSLDAREGYIATHGWRKETELTTVEFAKTLAELGVRRFIHTDIVRDGTLSEPNFTAISELISEIRVPVIAAGGISSLLHLNMLKQLGAEGAIIGKALYSGDIKLKEALIIMERD